MSRTLFVGDLHGCAEELEALLALAQAERVIALGDLFSKGPDAPGVWALLRACRAEAVLGNHDDFQLRSPEAARALPPDALRWLAGLPLHLASEARADRPWLAIHAGVDPLGGLAATSREAALTLRRYPRGGEDSPNPFWWERYQGPPLVIYGHDARRGLNDRRPHSLGLDSGCVYGGALSGYLLEEDRLLSVPARRVYRAVTA